MVGPMVGERGLVIGGRLDPRWRRILRADPCAYCGGPGGTVDHVVATAAAGGNAIENLTGACGPCNVEKADGSLLLFLLDRAVAADRDRFRSVGSFSGSALALREGLAAIGERLAC